MNSVRHQEIQTNNNQSKFFQNHQQFHYDNHRILEYQFHQIVKTIKHLESECEKSLQLRIKEWINKLDTVSDIFSWKKNRNLYAKVLLIMIKKNELAFPFDKRPPHSSLPTLSLYQIPFDIRKQMQNTDFYTSTDQGNLSSLNSTKYNLPFLNNCCKQTNDRAIYSVNQHRSRQKYSIQNKMVEVSSLQLDAIKTKDQKQIGNEIKQLLKYSYDLLSQNIDRVGSKSQAEELLKSIWNLSHFNSQN